MNPVIFYNDQYIPSDTTCIRADDRGLTLGDGIFETILSYNYKMPLFAQHWQRLISSANKLDIALPNKYSKEYFLAVINNLLKYNNIKPYSWQGIKIIISRGAGPRSIEPINNYSYTPNIIITVFNTTKPSLEQKNLIISDYKINPYSPLANIKTLNYLDKILAKQQALQQQYDDCLLVNINNNIAELSTSNVFFILDNNEIITPDINTGILPGITRQFIINLSRKMGYTVIEQKISVDFLNSKNDFTYKAKYCFATNSISGITLISSVNNYNFQTNHDNKILKLLYNHFFNLFI